MSNSNALKPRKGIGHRFLALLVSAHDRVEGRINFVTEKWAERGAVSGGKGRDDHLIGMPRSIEEAIGFEPAIGEPDIQKPARNRVIGAGLLFRWSGSSIRQCNDVVGAGRWHCARDTSESLLRLAFIAGSPAKDRVQPKQDDAGHHGNQKNPKQL